MYIDLVEISVHREGKPKDKTQNPHSQVTQSVPVIHSSTELLLFVRGSCIMLFPGGSCQYELCDLSVEISESENQRLGSVP